MLNLLYLCCSQSCDVRVLELGQTFANRLFTDVRNSNDFRCGHAESVYTSSNQDSAATESIWSSSSRYPCSVHGLQKPRRQFDHSVKLLSELQLFTESSYEKARVNQWNLQV